MGVPRSEFVFSPQLGSLVRQLAMFLVMGPPVSERLQAHAMHEAAFVMFLYALLTSNSQSTIALSKNSRCALLPHGKTFVSAIFVPCTCPCVANLEG